MDTMKCVWVGGPLIIVEWFSSAREAMRGSFCKWCLRSSKLSGIAAIQGV